MKKRKSPVALVTFLVVLIGGVAMANMMSLNGGGHSHDHGEQPQQQTQPQVASKPREAPKKEDLAKAALNTVTNEPSADAAPDLQMRSPNAEPMIVKPKVQTPKPQINEAQPSGQWYSDDSGRR
jgi:flagellar basal body-associated protein FliL